LRIAKGIRRGISQNKNIILRLAAQLKFTSAIAASAASAKIPDYAPTFRADINARRLALPALDHFLVICFLVALYLSSRRLRRRPYRGCIFRRLL
jgi:hypothetical protein